MKVKGGKGSIRNQAEAAPNMIPGSVSISPAIMNAKMYLCARAHICTSLRAVCVVFLDVRTSLFVRTSSTTDCGGNHHLYRYSYRTNIGSMVLESTSRCMCSTAGHPDVKYSDSCFDHSQFLIPMSKQRVWQQSLSEKNCQKHPIFWILENIAGLGPNLNIFS